MLLVKSFLKSKKAMAFTGVLAMYVLMVNINLIQRARALAEIRGLSKWLGGSDCTIIPIAEEVTVSENATKTLLASYPGSGKRFSWNVISALSNHAVADDWNFSGNLNKGTLAIKSSWPHKEGVWSWGNMMDQVVLLIRNPRWALPSYHTMRYELDYASSWEETFARIPNAYSGRPASEIWENWRDVKFESEMQNWVDYIDFWMQGGAEMIDGELTTHERCQFSEIECKPKAVIDFDTFYNEHPTSEFFKLSNVLDSSQNVQMIAAQARFCLLDKVYDDTSLHNGNRNGNGPVSSAFKFTAPQLEFMVDKVTTIRNKYKKDPWTDDPIAEQLVFILNNYLNQLNPEYWYQKAMDDWGVVEDYWAK